MEINDNNPINEKTKRAKAQILEHVKQNITDKNIRTYIFGYSDERMIKRELNGKLKYIEFMINIFHLAFYYAYDRYIFNLNSSAEKLDPKNPNARRIINSFEKTFIQYPVTSELIQFVLTDIQFEMKSGSVENELGDMFNKLCLFNTSNFSFVEYFQLFASYRENPSRFVGNSEDFLRIAQMLLKLIKNMAFLSEYDLRPVDDQEEHLMFVPNERNDEDPDDIFGAMHLFVIPPRKNDIYSLVGMEKSTDGEDKSLNLRYISVVSSNTIVLSVSNNPDGDDWSEVDGKCLYSYDPISFLSEICTQAEWNENKDNRGGSRSDFIDQIHTINYKYIKNLALAISDALYTNSDAKAFIYEEYGKKFRELFEMCGFPKNADSVDIELVNLDWDALLIMLLIEESPTIVLERLFHDHFQIFYTIASNICKRVFDPQMRIFNLKKNQLKLEVDKTVKENIILAEAVGFGKVVNKEVEKEINAKAAAMLIIDSLSYAQGNEKTERKICAGNIYDNKDILDRMQYDKAASERIKYVSIILGETFKHMLCFYSGLIDYGKEKALYDVKSFGTCLSETEIEKSKIKLIDKFFAAAERKAKELNDYSTESPEAMIKLMNICLDFCKECSRNIDTRNAIYTAIGKYEIINIKDIKNCEKKYLGSISPVNESNVDNWISFAKELLEYLKTGSFSNTKVSHALMNTTYPFTALYAKRNENYDGCRTVTFKIDIDITDNGKNDFSADVNVLSEFSYAPSEVYYCLPNVLRSNDKWWIDPVLISFKKFNSIFEQGSKENE